VTILDADLPVHAVAKPKKRLENQIEGVEEVEEEVNPIAEVQKWVLKDALRKIFLMRTIIMVKLDGQSALRIFKSKQCRYAVTGMDSLMLIYILSLTICLCCFSNQWIELSTFVAHICCIYALRT
jgi:hypothetical protein